MSDDTNYLLDKVEKTAYEYLLQGKTLACSQTVLLAIQEALGQVDKLMIKACGPMAGGSRVGSLCGALVGGLLAIGMKYGADYDNLSSLYALMNSHKYAKKLYKAFEDMFGSRFCPEIIGYDLNDPEQRVMWLKSGGKEKCAKLCGRTARVATEIILKG
jgi:C_GCAxxG_C_C family probable redox protein